MNNFDLKNYLAEGRLLKENDIQPYTDEIRRDEAEGLADDIELEGDIKQRFIADVIKATEGGSWDTFYNTADKIMTKYM